MIERTRWAMKSVFSIDFIRGLDGVGSYSFDGCI